MLLNLHLDDDEVTAHDLVLSVVRGSQIERRCVRNCLAEVVGGF